MMIDYKLGPSDAMSIKKYLQHVNIQNTGHEIVIIKSIKTKKISQIFYSFLYSLLFLSFEFF